MILEQFWLYAGILAFGYLVGSVPFGFLIGRLYGHDVRKEGSGNIGATNVTRVVGRAAGKVCFGLDVLKGLLPMLLLQYLTGHGIIPVPAFGMGEAAMILAVVGGHMFTLFLGFKGGKGIATAAGAVAAVTPYAALAVFVVWVIVFEASGYVSLGSIVAAAALPVFAWLFSYWRYAELSPGMIGFFVVLAAAAVWKHRSNIRRLLDGTENRFRK